MNSSEKIELRKEQRRESRAKVRQSLLISDYVRCKHFDIYQEAANFYTEVNACHPLKYDLRKTDQFKALKMGIPFHSKGVRGKYKKQRYEPIPTNSFTIICQQTASPEGDEQTAACPEKHPEGDEQTAACPEKHPEGEQQKIMQLRIPLLKPSVITQTVQIVTDEVIEENPLQVASNEIVPESTPLYPSLHEEIPNDILERIVNELREDPELQTIMTDIEQTIELEQIGMDIDIPIDDRLENELDELEFW